MQNGINLSKEQINSLLNMLKNGNTDSEKLKNMLSGSLSETQKSKMNAIISDPEKLNGLLSSPQAKALMEKFGKKQQGDKENGSA